MTFPTPCGPYKMLRSIIVKISILLMLVTWGNPCFSQQTIILSGVLNDSLQHPVELANITAMRTGSKRIYSFATSDAQGAFKLRLLKDSSCTIKISCVGYRTVYEDLMINKNVSKSYVLIKAENYLKEVKITLPVKITGDTISYKVDAFTNGKERKLKDVVAKLPGMEVDDEGKIKVQGKSVTKVMIDGKDFFTGDTKLASKNIPADVIDKINVIKNYSNVSLMQGLSNTDNYVLDIRLKTGKKNIVFGSGEANAGDKKRYLGHANLFYYTHGFSGNLIADANNVGLPALSFQDYINFNGGIRNITESSGSSFRLSSDALGLKMLQENKALNTLAHLGAFNFSYAPEKKLTISGFLIQSGINYKINADNLKTYIRDDIGNQENLLSQTQQNSTSAIGKVQLRFIPDAKLNIEYNAFVKDTRISEQGDQRSLFAGDTSQIQMVNHKQPVTFKQDLSVYFKPDRQNVYSLEASAQHLKQNNLMDIGLDGSDFTGLLPFGKANSLNLVQNEQVTTNSFTTALNYYYLLNEKNHVNLLAGIDLNHQRLGSALSDRQSLMSDTIFNDITYSYRDLYTGLGYTTRTGKFTIDPGLALHFYETNSQQPGATVNIGQTLLLPRIKVRYDLRKSKILTLSYKMSTEFFDVANLAKQYLLTGYNSLLQGNSELTNARSNNFALDYYDFDLYHFSNLYALFTFQQRNRDMSSSLRYDNNVTIYTPVNINRPNDQYSFTWSYDRRFRYAKFKFSGDIDYTHFSNILQNAGLIGNKSINQDYKTSVESAIDHLPILELGMEVLYNHYSSSSFGAQNYTITRPFAKIEATVYKDFIITGDYKYDVYTNHNASSRSRYSFLNVTLYYKRKESRFEFKTSILNLTNTRSIRKDAFNENYIETTKYFVQPRYILIGLTYSL